MKSGKIVFIMMALLYISFIGFISSAVPTVSNVTLQPENPEPLTSVEFSVTISDSSDIDGVWLIVKECDGRTGVCFPDDQNVSMSRIGDTNDYQKVVTLLHDDATYITYHLEIKSGGEWFVEDSVDVDLEIKNGNSNNGTPGFEIGFLFIVISIIILIYGRKRF